MTSASVKVNRLLLNKYCWMAQQFRNFNDTSSIIQWSNAMMTVKNLFLLQQETYIPQPPELKHRENHYPNNTYSICKQTVLSFPPAAKPLRILTPSSTSTLNLLPERPPQPLRILTPSSTSTLNLLPERPPPLSLCHPHRLSITSASAEPPFKKRKTLLPPQVDCNYHTAHQPSTPNPTHKTTITTKKPCVTTKSLPQYVVWWHENRAPYFENTETSELTWDHPDQGRTAFPNGDPTNKPEPPPDMPEIYKTFF